MKQMMKMDENGTDDDDKTVSDNERTKGTKWMKDMRENEKETTNK